jgi:hypothetical protein
MLTDDNKAAILTAASAIEEAMDKLADSPDDATDQEIRDKVRNLVGIITEILKEG